MEFNELVNEIKSGNLKYYNFYNSDLNLPIYFSTQYYLENKNDNIDNYNQSLHRVFYDIEVFKDNPNIRFDFNRSDFPINALTFFSTKENIYHCYILLIDSIKDKFLEENISNYIKDYKKQLIDFDYFKKENDINISIKIFDKEIDLITSFWNELKRLDPTVLGGFNSDNFDTPYIYRRTLQYYNDETNSVISKFNHVSFDGKKVKIPEYGNGDVQLFYKPRSEYGLNYGKTLASYSLDFISDVELKLKKFEYKGTNKNLDEFFLMDPINYLLYNLIDVILVVKLDEKLKHIELHNLIRRMQFTPYTRSLIGNSALYDSYILYKLTEKNNKIRHGINTENSISYKSDEFKDIPQPRNRKGIILPLDIESSDFRSIAAKFDGAYVKKSTAKIINKGLIMDLDASLPPWETIFYKRDGIIYIEKFRDYNFIPGDLALTWDDNNNICWRNILGKIEKEWFKNLITVKTENNRSVTVTSNHSIFFFNRLTNSVEKIKAEYLKIGDELVVLDSAYKEEICISKIIDIKKETYVGHVYDISVEETQRFFAGSGVGVCNTSLYPSMILQSNIGFDTLKSKIINPITYNFITFLDNNLGKCDLDPKVNNKIFEIVDTFIKEENPSKKRELLIMYYYLISKLLKVLFDSRLTLSQIMNPQNDKANILLSKYLIPFLDIFEEVHPNNKEYNNFAYDYIFDKHENVIKNYEYLYMIKDIHTPKKYIERLTFNQTIEFIKNYSFSITGCCFSKHEEYLGLFSENLRNLKSMRTIAKNNMFKYPVGSEDYKFYNNKQLAIKVASNSIYGCFGQKTFRYSNHYLAQTITTHGRMVIKLAQYITDEYVKSLGD